MTIRPRAADRALLAGRLADLAELFIVSQVDLGADAEAIAVTVDQHPGTRCDRCWRWYERMSARHSELCDRCDDAVAALNGPDRP